MSIHRKDKAAENPRLQCNCCRKWMRLHGRAADGTMFYRFFGGCGVTNGDHLAGKPNGGGPNDVCDKCCQTECQRIAAEQLTRSDRPAAPDLAAQQEK